MQLISLDTASLPELPPLALTIGNFDGVHLGHQAILKRLQATARQQGLKTAVMFFEPQPKEFFAAKKDTVIAPTRISSWQEKVTLLDTLSIDYAIIAPFDNTFRAQSAHAFTTRLKQLNVQHIMVGDDFRFGNDRSGDSQHLIRVGFSVDMLDTVLLDEERISSTRIRECLAQGDFEQASLLLGRPYSITGTVEYGDQIGRTIDFPTANVALNRHQPCLHGIYAVDVVSLEGEPLSHAAQINHAGVQGISPHSLFGAAHVGTRPAITNKPPEWRLEVHLPHFTGNLYDKSLKVTFLHFLHGERNYDGLEALKTGIYDDVEQLLRWREAHQSISWL